jgi:homoserine kinase
MKFRQVTVRVPATTANLGPGFDCLGLALGLWNRLRLEGGPSGISVIGEGADVLSRGEDNLVLRAASAVFREAGLPKPSLRLSCRNSIPLSRGLGSSAAAVVGGLVAANILCGEPLERATLLRVATALEGHPDNVAPALLGGCQIVVRDGDDLVTAGVRVPRWLRAVVFIPEVAMPTSEARAVLPPDVSRRDAVYNAGRVALLVNALATGKAEDLRVATQDALHQPAQLLGFE